MNVSLRRATLADVEIIAAAERVLFPDEAWSTAQIAEEIAHPARRYVLALDDDRAPGIGRSGPMIGYAGIMIAGDIADLHTIGTTTPGRGVGQALLAWCEREARAGGADKLMLEVRRDNARARDVYTRAGYVEVAVRPGYYHLPTGSVDAIVMERDLTAPTDHPTD